ncbi:hypothetical protein [Marinomonas polaris]|jgi:hypothetical protein|uniref:hypothetical protein n=1 Tax=Marinomonas polaris TaxID=293552 RepID=UPI003F9B857F|tara:strand:- start:12414 stop:13061 length:648 start_codon:yes stop_codon:yes gene_type:complete
MRNLQTRSATQPDLDDVSNLVRFKGCYLLNDIKLVKASHKHTYTVAIISDVEGTGELELRLLGEHFTDLHENIGEYLSLEAAVKHYNHGYFFYLAWYETIQYSTTNPVLEKLQQSVRKNDSDSQLEEMHNRVMRISDELIKSLCVSLLLDPTITLPYNRARKLIWKSNNIGDCEFCVQLLSLASHDKDIWFVGEKLSTIINPTPLKLWEIQQLGS